ncbi:MAG: rhomboid family intramembrane serine protease [Thermodesulfobacteriota bacterium]|nr:rhomboid family intramembrane serine protease [Thermodesulfobacteriota bacterium]
MIPIRDTIQSKNYPIVNTAIIGLNIVLFIIEMIKGRGLDQFIFTYGLVPARYSVPEIASYFSFGQQVFALFSFMFIHGGFWHLLGNMWSLYIFGDNVEDRLGPLRYLLFYLLCGWASGLSHLFINWHSNIPTIGASGAIAGVMGAYLISYPRSKILTLIPVFFIPFFIEVPAFFFLGLWFIIQFLSAAGSHGQVSGIAWWAHIGGFVSGIIFLKFFLYLPEAGMTNRLRPATSKRKTPRLQVLSITGSQENPHLYGNLIITPLEARFGTNKLVNIPWGFQKRLFRVKVPPGINNRTVLRLGGMGKQMDGGQRGNLYLKVLIQ